MVSAVSFSGLLVDEKEEEESLEEPKPESLSVLRLKEVAEKEEEESFGEFVPFLVDLCGDSLSLCLPAVPLALSPFACCDKGRRTKYLLPGCCVLLVSCVLPSPSADLPAREAAVSLAPRSGISVCLILGAPLELVVAEDDLEVGCLLAGAGLPRGDGLDLGEGILLLAVD